LTDFTPPTVRATRNRLAFRGCRAHEAAQLNTPLKVSTLISADFSVGSLRIAAFHLGGDHGVVQ